MHEPIENEEKMYREAWSKWKTKIETVCRQRALEGMVGCSFDDLTSLARQVMLYTLRSYNPTEAKFSTYLYNNLLNAIKTEYSKTGMAREGFKVVLRHKRTGQEQTLSELFHSKEQAVSSVTDVGGQRSTSVLFWRENRVKRIPPTVTIPLFGKPAEDGSEDTSSRSPYELIGTVDRRSMSFTRVARQVAKKISKRTDRKILVLLYKGHTLREIARVVRMRVVDVEERLKTFRRILASSCKELSL